MQYSTKIMTPYLLLPHNKRYSKPDTPHNNDSCNRSANAHPAGSPDVQESFSMPQNKHVKENTNKKLLRSTDGLELGVTLTPKAISIPDTHQRNIRTFTLMKDTSLSKNSYAFVNMDEVPGPILKYIDKFKNPLKSHRRDNINTFRKQRSIEQNNRHRFKNSGEPYFSLSSEKYQSTFDVKLDQCSKELGDLIKTTVRDLKYQMLNDRKMLTQTEQIHRLKKNKPKSKRAISLLKKLKSNILKTNSDITASISEDPKCNFNSKIYSRKKYLKKENYLVGYTSSYTSVENICKSPSESQHSEDSINMRLIQSSQLEFEKLLSSVSEEILGVSSREKQSRQYDGILNNISNSRRNKRSENKPISSNCRRQPQPGTPYPRGKNNTLYTDYITTQYTSGTQYIPGAQYTSDAQSIPCPQYSPDAQHITNAQCISGVQYIAGSLSQSKVACNSQCYGKGMDDASHDSLTHAMSKHIINTESILDSKRTLLQQCGSGNNSSQFQCRTNKMIKRREMSKQGQRFNEEKQDQSQFYNGFRNESQIKKVPKIHSPEIHSPAGSPEIILKDVGLKSGKARTNFITKGKNIYSNTHEDIHFSNDQFHDCIESPQQKWCDNSNKCSHITGDKGSYITNDNGGFIGNDKGSHVVNDNGSHINYKAVNNRGKCINENFRRSRPKSAQLEVNETNSECTVSSVEDNAELANTTITSPVDGLTYIPCRVDSMTLTNIIKGNVKRADTPYTVNSKAIELVVNDMNSEYIVNSVKDKTKLVNSTTTSPENGLRYIPCRVNSSTLAQGVNDRLHHANRPSRVNRVRDRLKSENSVAAIMDVPRMHKSSKPSDKCKLSSSPIIDEFITSRVDKMQRELLSVGRSHGSQVRRRRESQSCDSSTSSNTNYTKLKSRNHQNKVEKNYSDFKNCTFMDSPPTVHLDNEHVSYMRIIPTGCGRNQFKLRDIQLSPSKDNRHKLKDCHWKSAKLSVTQLADTLTAGAMSSVVTTSRETTRPESSLHSFSSNDSTIISSPTTAIFPFTKIVNSQTKEYCDLPCNIQDSHTYSEKRNCLNTDIKINNASHTITKRKTGAHTDAIVSLRNISVPLYPDHTNENDLSYKSKSVENRMSRQTISCDYKIPRHSEKLGYYHNDTHSSQSSTSFSKDTDITEVGVVIAPDREKQIVPNLHSNTSSYKCKHGRKRREFILTKDTIMFNNKLSDNHISIPSQNDKTVIDQPRKNHGLNKQIFNSNITDNGSGDQKVGMVSTAKRKKDNSTNQQVLNKKVPCSLNEFIDMNQKNSITPVTFNSPSKCTNESPTKFTNESPTKTEDCILIKSDDGIHSATFYCKYMSHIETTISPLINNGISPSKSDNKECCQIRQQDSRSNMKPVLQDYTSYAKSSKSSDTETQKYALENNSLFPLLPENINSSKMDLLGKQRESGSCDSQNYVHLTSKKEQNESSESLNDNKPLKVFQENYRKCTNSTSKNFFNKLDNKDTFQNDEKHDIFKKAKLESVASLEMKHNLSMIPVRKQDGLIRLGNNKEKNESSFNVLFSRTQRQKIPSKIPIRIKCNNITSHLTHIYSNISNSKNVSYPNTQLHDIDQCRLKTGYQSKFKPGRHNRFETKGQSRFGGVNVKDSNQLLIGGKSATRKETTYSKRYKLAKAALSTNPIYFAGRRPSRENGFTSQSTSTNKPMQTLSTKTHLYARSTGFPIKNVLNQV